MKLTITNISCMLGLFLYAPFSFGQVPFFDQAGIAGFDYEGQSRGISIADYNNDSFDDIYVSLLNTANLFFENNGDGTFEEKAHALGIDFEESTGVALWGDIDNDGFLDLILANRQSNNKLYRNLGDGTFEDITEDSGINVYGDTRSAMLGDVDSDGFVDLYFANINARNYLFKNNGDGTFTDITVASGTNDPQFSMGAMFFDFDLDNDLDLYLTHDGFQPNILLENDGTGVFTDISEESGLNYASFGMGVDFGDINNDGWPDVYITNLGSNVLFLNNQDGTFSDITQQAMVDDLGMGWSTQFLDYDNDGWQDIYVANDTYFPVLGENLPNLLYRNKKGSLNFEIVSSTNDVGSMKGSYGAACSDLDNDGRVDIAVANDINDPNQLFCNKLSPDNNWIKIKVIGTESNAAGIGAQIRIQVGDWTLYDQVAAGTGFLSQNSLTQHFGLAQFETIEQLTVTWPSGIIDTYNDLAANQTYTIVENESLTSLSKKDIDVLDQLTIAPNPIVTNTTLQFHLKSPTFLTIDIWNTSGQLVQKLANRLFETGPQQVIWRVDPILPAGLYTVRLQTNDGQSVHLQTIYSK